MNISKLKQPEIITIDEELRLRKFDGIYDFALEWYLDRETVDLVDGRNASLYDYEKLKKMYTFLDNKGELYFIEVRNNDTFLHIGDVTLCKEDMPIAIGDKNYRGKGIGIKVISELVKRGKTMGFSCLMVNEIFDYNFASINLFKKAGFIKYERKNNGYSYILRLE